MRSPEILEASRTTTDVEINRGNQVIGKMDRNFKRSRIVSAHPFKWCGDKIHIQDGMWGANRKGGSNRTSTRKHAQNTQVIAAQSRSASFASRGPLLADGSRCGTLEKYLTAGYRGLRGVGGAASPLADWTRILSTSLWAESRRQDTLGLPTWAVVGGDNFAKIQALGGCNLVRSNRVTALHNGQRRRVWYSDRRAKGKGNITSDRKKPFSCLLQRSVIDTKSRHSISALAGPLPASLLTALDKHQTPWDRTLDPGSDRFSLTTLGHH
ncbi:hypothetical protein SODALDRAFT_362808 [Sodiomyces alkalinus F11]|uniref:Uncharacterized protein n=1 Tax=Sodiomyces alkalinus (strain CBS 110278 / VKM F-3762 / F11) TaxID=1314773 RepID=A0A3N2PN43_SODAK|nr:hypothetical protein SODALDRAFT_362808 [Sodiomyces alkalinus F11]ROT35947.1 hypothetical protein SODALDRAFT_362808 [Sodiomyces alkalinus F11]